MHHEKLIRAGRTVSLLLLLVYPFVVHTGILTDAIWPALAVLLMLVLIKPHFFFSRRVLLLFLPVAGILLWLTPHTVYSVLYAPPLLITLLFLALFAESLMPGNEALVSRIARIMHETPSPQLLRYTHAVTVGWVVFLSLMLLEVIVLTLFATAKQWSLFTNFYNYFFIGLFFLVEFMLRRFFIDPAERISLAQFFHRLVTIDYRKLFFTR